MILNKLKSILAKGIIIVPLLFMVGFSVSYFAGCAGTPNRIAYQGSGTARITVQEGLKLWNEFVKAGKTTTAQEESVRAAYMKVQTAAFVACDAGRVLSAAGADPAPNLAAAFEQATGDFTQDRVDFLNLLTSLGVKLPTL